MSKRQEREDRARGEGTAAARAGDPRTPPYKGDLAVVWLAAYDFSATGGVPGVQAQSPPAQAQTAYYVRRANMPCPCCGRAVLESGYKACVVISTTPRVAYMQCRSCRVSGCQSCARGAFKIPLAE